MDLLVMRKPLKLRQPSMTIESSPVLNSPKPRKQKFRQPKLESESAIMSEDSKSMSMWSEGDPVEEPEPISFVKLYNEYIGTSNADPTVWNPSQESLVSVARVCTRTGAEGEGEPPPRARVMLEIDYD